MINKSEHMYLATAFMALICAVGPDKNEDGAGCIQRTLLRKFVVQLFGNRFVCIMMTCVPVLAPAFPFLSV